MNLTCSELNNLMGDAFRSTYLPPYLLGCILLVVSSFLILYIIIKKKLYSTNAEKLMLLVVIAMVLYDLYQIILWQKTFKDFYTVVYPVGKTAYPYIHLLFIFIFGVFLAWKKEIPLGIRYLFIVGYSVFFISLVSFGSIIYLEQIKFKEQFCFGFSCPLRQQICSTY